MPDLLGATNPVPGHDKVITNRNVPVSPNNTNLQNVPDLSKITRADGRTEKQGSTLQEDRTVRYESNFQTFMQRLKETPGMAESLARIFSGRQGTVVVSGMKEGISAQMAKLMQMMQMNEKELLNFLVSQMKAGTKFGGALFDLLRSAYANAGSDAVRSDILQFMKAYSDFASSAHIEGSMLRNLERMADGMPGKWSEQLRDMIAQLKNQLAAGDRQSALSLLRSGIFPLMSGYVSQTHDMGLPRQLLSILTLDVTRYENGAEQNVLDAFHMLRGYGTLKNQLQMIDDTMLMQILKNAQAYGDTAAIRFSDALLSAAMSGLRGEGGQELQQGFQNLISAMLINQSVYMPLNHYLLPMEWEGRMLFSEMWVDPDAEDDRKSGGDGGAHTLRFLLKMDVQSLGLFDVILSAQKENVDLQILCPERVTPFLSQIEAALTEILQRHNLKPVRVSAKKMDHPVALTDVFPKIFQERNGINVKV